MENKIIHRLSSEETIEIENLYEKRAALENLTKIIDPENEKLYNKLVLDYGKTIIEYDNWWKTMSEKYNWEGSSWKIDFDEKAIVLVEK